MVEIYVRIKGSSSNSYCMHEFINIYFFMLEINYVAINYIFFCSKSGTMYEARSRMEISPIRAGH